MLSVQCSVFSVECEKIRVEVEGDTPAPTYQSVDPARIFVPDARERFLDE